MCAGAAAAAEDAELRLVRDAVGVARDLRESEDVYDQIAGAGTLVEIGDKDSLQFLVDHLSHTDWSMMRSAIDTLLNVEHPAGLDVIYRYAAATKDAMFMKFLAESCASHPREDMADSLPGRSASTICGCAVTPCRPWPIPRWTTRRRACAPSPRT